jgi:alanine dehydrogenase
MALFLTEQDVRELLTMPMALEAVETGFQRLAAGTAMFQPRHRLHLPGKAFFHYMAAADTVSGLMGMKQYTVSRDAVRFLVTLYDLQTGDLLAMIEADVLGQMRTGAASGIATKYMARPEARTAAVLGSGSQARTQLEAVAAVRPVEKARCWSPSEERRRKFAAEMTERLKIDVAPSATAEEAVRGAEIICTATTASEPVVQEKWLDPGCHINAMGSNFPTKCELDGETVRRAGVIAADSVTQSREEAGDLVLAFAGNAAQWERVHELSEIVAGRVAGRTNAGEVTVFKSNGIAMEDVAAGARVYELARRQGRGTEIPVWAGKRGALR